MTKIVQIKMIDFKIYIIIAPQSHTLILKAISLCYLTSEIFSPPFSCRYQYMYHSYIAEVLRYMKNIESHTYLFCVCM